MKKRYSRQCFFLAVCILFLTDVSGVLAVEDGQPPIPGDDVPTVSPDIEQLPQVETVNGKTYLTITATRVPEKNSGVSANLTVIDREELDRAAADNVGDLLAE